MAMIEKAELEADKGTRPGIELYDVLVKASCLATSYGHGQVQPCQFTDLRQDCRSKIQQL